MSEFAGIPAGRLVFTALPNVLLSEWLPLADDLSEVKVTLHIFYLLTQKKGSPRFVTERELASDATLMASLGFKQEKLKRGLERATAHQALLCVRAADGDRYLFNTPESRRALESLADGALKAAAVAPDQAATAIPNIFKLYEENIGVLSPLIVDELKEAEAEYPAQVILDAFRIAAENNVRSWRYVNRILSDWTRGKKHEKTRRPSSGKRRPTITGKLANVGKPK